MSTPFERENLSVGCYSPVSNLDEDVSDRPQNLTDSKNRKQKPAEERDMTAPSSIPYLYYSVYTQDGAIPSHRPIDPEDPYVACINLKRIAPPHTIASLKRSIAKNEKVVHHDHTVLYADMFQLSSMENGARVSAPGMFPGSTAAQPLAFVVLDPPSSQVEGRSLPSDQLLACMSASDQPAEPPSPIDMSTNIAPSVFSFATPGRKRR